VPCCVVPPADLGVVKAHHEDERLRMGGLFQLSEEGLIYFLLIRWSVSDTHYNITCADLPSYPDLSGDSAPIPTQRSMHFSCSLT